MIQGPLVGDSGFRRSWDLDSNSFISWCPMDTIAWSKFRTFIWKGPLNIKIFIEEIHRQVDLTNGSLSFKPLHFVHTIHIHVCLLSVFQAWREKSLCGRAKKNWSRGGFFFLQRWDYTLLIIIDYLWLLLILIVAVCYWLLLIVYYPYEGLLPATIFLINVLWHFCTPLLMLMSESCWRWSMKKILCLIKKSTHANLAGLAQWTFPHLSST